MAAAAEFQFSEASPCERARNLLDAYYGLLAGQRVRVAYENYYVEYKPAMAADIAMLRDLYQQARLACPDPTLPDLSPGARQRRGPPAFGKLGNCF